MERELVCSHCEKPFRDPVILPCWHNACLNCAESLISYAEVTRTGPESGLHDDVVEGAGECNEEERPPEGRVAMISCPVCEKSICIGSRDVLSFPRNRILVKLVARAFGTAEIACEMCDAVPASPGTISCEQCEITYCERCCRTYHPRRGPLASHVLVSPSSVGKAARPDVVKCSDHREENISMYCVKCKTTVCYLCVDRGRHRKHDVKALGEMFKEQKVCGLVRRI